ncbi:glycoside hydrolase family 43 protein [Bacteroides sp. 51]|uniref:glycoside hydrolase family 43 protein n=1 Tax=Bacteroides sp. 51 TaxID=2302938 RepID=UPI0019403912|nr:glycoside hydrolase family 43 protein [Bacteroides sp. 51]
MKTYSKILLSLFLLSFSVVGMGQGFTNPILPGFYPDPSVCRVGDDYYIVNSSFQYFPSVPIHHSKDLINWENIGYVLDRPSQVKLEKIGFWNGIYAPSIRYHDGLFYMVTTNTSDKGNLYVYTDNPAGDWSDPVWVDMGGIDPDIFFDEDGKTYFITAMGGIHICEVDISTGQRLTETQKIWDGTGARHTEAPHIYKKDGYYYLLVAEGGTEYGHKATIARSRSITGPYDSNPANPILTHINQNGAFNPIQGVGHADFIQAHDGSWWTVFLGFRPQSHTHHLLGRETFLAPVRWDNDAWPVVNDNGTVALSMTCTTLPQVKTLQKPAKDDFNESALGYEWNYLCNPNCDNYSLTAKKGTLRLKASTVRIDETDSPTFVGRRQQHINFRATTALDFSNLKENSEAGLTTYMASNYRYDLSVKQTDDKTVLSLSYYIGSLRHIEKEIILSGKRVYLRVDGRNDMYSYSYSTDNKTFQKLGDIDTRFISTETAGGFTGVYIGLFAQSETLNNSFADFDWFEYIPVFEN